MSGMFRTGFGAAFLVGAMALSIASGCGTRVGGTGLPTTAPTVAPTVAPPVPVVPTPAPMPSAVPLLPATAQVASESSYGGSWACLGLCRKKVDAQIAVTNPNAVAVVALVTVTFTSGGQSAGTFPPQTVQLPPNGKATFDAKATQTSDVATAQVTSTSALGSSAGGPSADTAPAYGSVPGYGTTTSPYQSNTPSTQTGAPSYGSSAGYGSGY